MSSDKIIEAIIDLVINQKTTYRHSLEHYNIDRKKYRSMLIDTIIIKL